MQEALKDKEGTIETLERQLVQAGIKGKVMQAEMEITKKKEEVKGTIDRAGKDVEDGAKQAVKDFSNKAVVEGRILQEQAQNIKKDLESEEE